MVRCTRESFKLTFVVVCRGGCVKSWKSGPLQSEQTRMSLMTQVVRFRVRAGHAHRM